MDLVFIKRIFSNTHRFELWTLIERSIINFLVHKKLLPRRKDRKWVEGLSVSSFEVLGGIEEDRTEFESFLGAIFSKSPDLDNYYVKSIFTHSNFVDTSNSLLIKEFNICFITALEDFLVFLEKKSKDWKNILQIGRTHGIHAEPISFGYKFALLYIDLKGILDDIYACRKYLEVVTIDYENLFDNSMAVEMHEYLSRELDMYTSTSNESKFPREKYFHYLGILNLVCQNISKLAVDLKLLSHEEVNEVLFNKECEKLVEEIEIDSKYADEGYVSMGLAIHDYSVHGQSTFEYERRAMNMVMKSAYWNMHRLRKLMSEMVVNKEQMRKNIRLYQGKVLSQKVMLHLIKRGKFSRQEVLNDLKEISKNIADFEGITFLDELEKSNKYKKYLHGDLTKLFSDESFLVNIDALYDRIYEGKEKTKIHSIDWEDPNVKSHLFKLIEKINIEYRSERSPVAIVAFAERTVMFLGQILPYLDFPLTVTDFEHKRLGFEIDTLTFNEKFFQSKRVLVVEELIDKHTPLEHFISKLKDSVMVRDVRVCCMMKTSDVEDDYFVVNWYGMEVEPESSHFALKDEKEEEEEEEEEEDESKQHLAPFELTV